MLEFISSLTLTLSLLLIAENTAGEVHVAEDAGSRQTRLQLQFRNIHVIDAYFRC